MFKNLIIYYFSGTGNARNVAYWFADIARKKGVKTTIIDISKTNRLSIAKPPKDALIGFCSPTHGFNLPPVMLNFIARFPKSNNNKVFIVNTRAGMKIYKLFCPGLSGIALYYAFFVLLFKGYKTIGMRSIDLPSNWISIHPGLRKKIVESIYSRNKRITQNFAEKLLSGKKIYRALFDLIQDILISPIAIGYYFAGRFVLAKTFIANKNCNNCGICIKSCPIKALKEKDGKPFWTYRCESCMRCMNICPERAIQTCHGIVALIFYLVYTFIIAFIYQEIPLKELNIFQNGLVRLTFETIIVIPFYYLGYRIFHYLMRFTLIERIVSFTSFTWYKFWRRYKAPKV